MLKLTSSLAGSISGVMGNIPRNMTDITTKKPLVVFQMVATTSRITIPKEIILTQNKREHYFQLTLALHYVNKL